MSPQQTKIIDTVIAQGGKWINAKSIAELTGVKDYNVHKIMTMVQYPGIQRAKVAMEGSRTPFTAWRFSGQDTTCEEAILLAKKHPGIWGQLEWAK
jgi:hypothetical protein